VAPDCVRLRRIESTDELTPAAALAREFGEWASEEIRAQFGIVIGPTRTIRPSYSTNCSNRAHTLYRSVGFVPTGSYPGREFEGATHDVSVFMRLDLGRDPGR
jgi:hypothetical protein